MASSRTILITGATDGIGKQTALELAKNHNNCVIVHGRSTERCDSTVNWIKKSSGNQNVFSVLADFAHMSSVPKMAEVVKAQFPRLNVLILNAGVLLPNREISADGLEMTFQVNHLAHFALVHHLRDLLRSNTPARVVVVSSICHAWHPMDWKDLHAERSYEKYEQYSRTKLANHLFGFALARRLQSIKGITCNILEPGVVQTKLLRAGGYSGSSIEQGAVTPVYLAQSSEVEGVSGRYYNHTCKQIDASVESRNVEDQERLWRLSEEICEKLGVL